MAFRFAHCVKPTPISVGGVGALRLITSVVHDSFVFQLVRLHVRK
jgi:hypothetical protein